MGLVKITVITERQKSKYKNKPDYVEIKIGDEAYYYSAENESCAEFFAGRRGQTISVKADGREDDATITFVGQSGENLPPKVQQRREEPPQQQEQPQGNQRQARQQTNQRAEPQKPDAEKAAKYHIARNRSFSIIAWRATLSLQRECEDWYRKQFNEPNWVMHPTSVNTTFQAMLYGADRNGIPGPHMPLDIKFPEVKTEGGAK